MPRQIVTCSQGFSPRLGYTGFETLSTPEGYEIVTRCPSFSLPHDALLKLLDAGLKPGKTG